MSELSQASQMNEVTHREHGAAPTVDEEEEEDMMSQKKKKAKLVVVDPDDARCHCGAVLMRKTSYSAKNRDRVYYTCPLKDFHDLQWSGGCNAFTWADERQKMCECKVWMKENKRGGFFCSNNECIRKIKSRHILKNTDSVQCKCGVTANVFAIPQSKTIFKCGQSKFEKGEWSNDVCGFAGKAYTLIE